MRQGPTTATISGVMIALGLTLGGSRLRAQAEAAEPGPLSLTVALAGSATVVEGEPVLLRYVINNSSGQEATVYTADISHIPLITERITDAAGKPLVPLASPIPPHHMSHTMTSWDGLGVPGSGPTTWETVANDHVTFPHPGRYVLRVHVENGYVMGRMNDAVQGAHHVLAGEYAFPLNVVEANPAYLRATAERLRRRVLPTLDVNVRAMLIKALFSMSEDTASASWQTLVEEPNLDGYSLSLITKALARIHTARAADVLAEMVWEPAQKGLVLDEASACQHLYEIYDTGDAGLKKHIEDLYKQHGAEISHFRIE